MAVEKGQPAYSSQLFVDHEPEICLVEQAVQDALARKERRARAITFYGERGSGKTWLSRHLGETLPKMHFDVGRVETLTLLLAPPTAERDAQTQCPHAACYFFDEADEAKDAQQAPETIVRQMLHWVCTQWGVAYAAGASASDLLYWLGRDLPRRSDVAFVLIVDSVFEFGKGNERLPWLEDYLLAPIASLDNGLVVMTGRGALFPWRSVPLRQDNIEQILPPFREDHVSEQLTRCNLNADHTKEITELGGGFPLNNYILGRAESLEAGLRELVEVLLDFVPEQTQRSIREALEALCVLDGFREREIAVMVACRRGQPDQAELTMEDARSVRDLLLKNHLMRWQDDGYVINESVRVAYRSYLQRLEPGLFAKLAQRALTLYEEWSDKFPNARSHYQQRAEQMKSLLDVAGIQAPTTAR